MSKYYHYYVEGADEEKLLTVLRTEMGLIIPGKIEKFNIVQDTLSPTRLMQLKRGTTVVLVFDTDAGNIDIFKTNIRKLKNCSAVSSIVFVPQVKNLEDELIRSCNIKRVKELLGSKSNSNYKHDLIMEKNLKDKLQRKCFDINKFWSEKPDGIYENVTNDSSKIKRNTGEKSKRTV